MAYNNSCMDLNPDKWEGGGMANLVGLKYR